MSRLKELYQQNIYGVIGTLAFHLIVVTVMLIAEVRTKGEAEEEAIIIDFSTEELEIPEPEEELQPEEQTSQPSQDPNVPRELGSSRPVNDAAQKSKDPFFDADYQRELEEARQLAQNVSQTLATEIPEIGDIDMPEETTEGMKPEDIKNVIFKGKSNIHYYLENRYHVSLRIPIYLAEGGGEIIVDILVNRNGRVVSAEPRLNSSITDPKLPAYAKQAALKTRFNADSSAPARQKGTITYNFVPQ